MRVLIERDAALKALGRVQSVAKPKGAIPITANVRIETGATEVVFTTNNLDQQAVGCAKATIQEPGSVTVEARRLYDIVRAFPDGGEVLLSYKDDGVRLTAQCGSARYQIPTLPAGSFPQFSSLENAAGGVIERDALQRLLSRASFAMAVQDTKYLLHGMHLHVGMHEDALHLAAAATDILVLAQVMCPAPEGFEEFPGIILPFEAVAEALRFLADAPELVEIRANASLFEMRADGAELATKTVDGIYPNYVYAIPQANPVRLKLDVETLQACINRVLLVADGKSRTVRVALEAERLVLTARSEDLTGGEVRDEMPIEYAGPACELGFNARRVKDVLGVVKGENAFFHFAEDPTQAAVLVTDSADPDCRYVLTLHRG